MNEKIGRHRSKTVSWILLLCILSWAVLGVVTPATLLVNAKEGTQKTIRIGYIDYAGFLDKQPDGTFSGYGKDYLEEIAKYTGWKYVYSYDTWDNQLQKLSTGEIDFVCHAQITEERQQQYLFSKYSVGVESTVLYVRKNDDRYFYNDYKSFEGMKVAMMGSSFQNQGFQSYAEEKGFTYEPVEYSTANDCFAALERKETDAVVMGSVGIREGYRVVSRVGSDPFYFMTGKDNARLVMELDEALGEIRAESPYFEADLYNKYYGQAGVSSEVLLTREESEYVKQAKPIQMAVIPNRAPYSSVDEEGNLAGITLDILGLLQERSGLQFQFDMMPAGMTTKEYLEAHPDAMVGGVMVDNPLFQNEDYLISAAFVTDDVGLVCRRGMKYSLDAPEASYILAIPRSYTALKAYIQNHYPQFQIIEAEKSADCMQMVMNHEADFMSQNVNVIRPLLANPHYEKLTILPTFFMEEPMGIISNNTGDNQILIGIMDKCIGTITDKEISQITVNHTVANSYKPSMGDMIYKFRMPLLAIGFLIFICMVIMIAFILYRKESFNKLEIKNKQLADAVAQADNANQAKSAFLTRMSHEIRTPMNAIVGITTIAKHYKDDPIKVEEYLGKIEVASKVLLNIINDVLDMSAIESNKIKIGKKPFDLKSILTEIATIYYAQCRQKGVVFEMDTAQIRHEKLIGDGLRINQVLLNLMSNAYKFTPKGGKISILVKELSENDGKVFFEFKVIDTGEGMTEEMQQRLFKPFEQEESATAQRYGGSGLGLSIAKNLVEMMHGSISATSRKGVGTTFTVSVPFQVDKEAISDTPQLLEQTDIKGIHALIVDDDQETREYTSVILDRIGVPYELAKDGKEALEKLQLAREEGRHFDICFIDWKMPGLSGIDVTREIRKTYEKDLLVIIVSAFDTTEIKGDAVKAGADMFITKPLFQSSVFNVLMKLSGGQYVRQTAAEEEYDFGGKKVLLAEDTQFNAEVAIELLNIVNMKVDCAQNGEIAVHMFDTSEPGTYEAILMDVQMPVMDGYEATRAIRALSRPDAKTIPIIAMTANAFTEDVSAALNAGMNDHIAKPIDTQILYSTLKKMENYSSTIR